jgi:hypothetical protein
MVALITREASAHGSRYWALQTQRFTWWLTMTPSSYQINPDNFRAFRNHPVAMAATVSLWRMLRCSFFQEQSWSVATVKLPVLCNRPKKKLEKVNCEAQYRNPPLYKFDMINYTSLTLPACVTPNVNLRPSHGLSEYIIWASVDLVPNLSII